MITCWFPVEKANELANAARLPSTIQSIMENLKTEAAYYFSDIEGAKRAYIVVNMGVASQISAMVEPLFLELGAVIEVHPVMSLEELDQATPAIEQASQEYG